MEDEVTVAPLEAEAIRLVTQKASGGRMNSPNWKKWVMSLIDRPSLIAMMSLAAANMKTEYAVMAAAPMRGADRGVARPVEQVMLPGVTGDPAFDERVDAEQGVDEAG